MLGYKRIVIAQNAGWRPFWNRELTTGSTR